MELLYSTTMGAASMVLTTILIYLCFVFIFVGDLQLIDLSRTQHRTHVDAFGFFNREMEIYMFSTVINTLCCIILQPVIYIVLFASYDLDVLEYAKFMIILLAAIILDRVFFIELMLNHKRSLTPERILIHSIFLGVIISCIITYYFRTIGLT